MKRRLQRTFALFRMIARMKGLRWVLAVFAVLACAYGIRSDTLTMTAYYPSPMGSYYQLMTTDIAYFARDGGSVSIGGFQPKGRYNTMPSGNVLTVYGNAAFVNNANNPGSPTLSIGTTNDGSLNVNGTAAVTGILQAKSGVVLPTVQSGPCLNGTITLNGAGAAQVCVNSSWQPVGQQAAAAAKGTVMQFSGASAQCPLGSTPTDYHWLSGTCFENWGTCSIPGGWGGGICWYIYTTASRYTGSLTNIGACFARDYDAYRCVVN